MTTLERGLLILVIVLATLLLIGLALTETASVGV